MGNVKPEKYIFSLTETMANHKFKNFFYYKDIIECRIAFKFIKEELPSKIKANPNCCLNFELKKNPGNKVFICTKNKYRCFFSLLQLGHHMHNTCKNDVK